MRNSSIATLATLALFVAPALAQTRTAIDIKSTVLAVKEVTDAKGVKTNIFVAPTRVVPGTPLVIALKYQNISKLPVTKAVVDNPIPNAVRFTGLGIKSEFGVVSVDGGKTYGNLAALKIVNPDKTSRPARPNDVTHVRWVFAAPIQPGQSGTVMFYGAVE